MAHLGVGIVLTEEVHANPTVQVVGESARTYFTESVNL
jgi:hypothetical protein